MSVSFGMVLFGALLVVAGWKNVSLSALARGDSSTPKGSSAGTSPSSSSSSSPSPAAQGKGGHTVGGGGGGGAGGAGGAW